MKIQTKSLVIIVSTFVALIVIAIAGSRYIIHHSYLSLEQREIMDDIQRSVNALHQELGAIEIFCLDWAAWDDSYRFIQDRNQEYIKSNLPDTTFSEGNLDMIVYLNRDAEVIFGSLYDARNGIRKPLPLDLISHLHSKGKLYSPVTSSVPVKGVLMLEDGSYLIASQPIVKSDGSGNPLGVLIMGRKLDADAVQHIATGLKLSLSLNAYADTIGEPAGGEIYSRLDAGELVVLHAQDDEFISGYTLIRDIGGKPGLLLQVTKERKIYKQGKRTGLYLFVVLLVTAFVFTVVMLILMRTLVLSRITLLGEQVMKIRDSHDLGERVDACGDDEIRLLADHLNKMLAMVASSQECIEAARRTAEDANFAKSEFLSHMSHELRTPMNAILGFAQLIRMDADHPLSAEQRKYVDEILSAGSHLMELLNELLDLAKIESGKLKITMSKCSLHDLVKDCVAWVQMQADNKNISLVDKISAKPDQSVYVDMARCKQILLNLMTNAVKYSDEHSVVTLDYQVITENHIRIKVIDSGPGLAPEDQERIFQAFERLHKHEKIEGVGIGLVISKRLAELMGGAMGVDSKVGDGATFWFDIKSYHSESRG